jgi:phosphopantetheinyl transferase
MPVISNTICNDSTQLAVWHIVEEESAFEVPLQRTITHKHKRLQHLAGRQLLVYLQPSFPLHAIAIADTRKPYLPDEAYHFSISHCGDYAAAIVSTQQRVGIDIEIVTEKVHRIKHKFLHPQELRWVNSFLPEQQTLLLTLLWSAKEALFKWLGTGEVDFSEMLRVMPFAQHTSGQIQAAIIHPSIDVALTVHYTTHAAGWVMCWVLEG